MTPGLTLVRVVNQALLDPDFRESIRQMHSEGQPLIDMVEALGLDGDMTQYVRAIVERLPPETVDGIRRATLEMLDGTDYSMPLQCEVTEAEVEAGVPVDVDVADEPQGTTIVIRRATGG